MLNLRSAAFLSISAVVAMCTVGLSFGQTSGTGALSGTIFDPTGAVVSDAQVKVINEATAETRNVVSQAGGTYFVPLLPPGTYRVEVTKAGFKQSIQQGVQVVVSETDTLVTHLEIGAISQEVTINSNAEQLQTDTTALGRVTSGLVINDLPLVSRNYTQVMALNPGVSTDVENAGALGRSTDGAVGGAQDTVAHGGTTSDNNFQMDGVDINDIETSGHFSGGIAIPNPDSIQEFKVQTGQYDASAGRSAGADVDVITKSGTNQFHGDVWEYFRNEDLNANDFFRNLVGESTPILRQNQFGGTFGGPILKDKLFFFGSYQGTRQLNGLDTSCSSSFSEPPLTNDRSAAALGALFAGQKDIGGVPVAANGSNINPAALAILNYKLPNGQYVIPTPQTINPSKLFPVQGFSAFSIPCTFNEDQYLANGDYLQSDKSKFSFRFFLGNDNQDVSLPGTNIGGPTAPGYPTLQTTGFRNIAFSHTYAFSPTLFNEVNFGFHITHVDLVQKEAFNYSDVGITVPPYDNTIQAIDLFGSVTLGGNGQSLKLDQGAYTLHDTISYSLGRHSLRFGGGFERYQNDILSFNYLAGLVFLSYPDFLLGLSGAQNGSPYSDVYESIDFPSETPRRWRILNADAWVQDDFKVSPRLTVNLGFRYEREGDQGDLLGRNTAFNFGLADPNPPVTGTLAGFVVPNNYKAGTIPAGVTQIGNNLGINGDGQNTWNPRVGFAYRLPHSERFVLRGGYGVFHSRITGQPFLQLISNPPFGDFRITPDPYNSAATLQNPFAPPPTIPSFIPYYPPNAPICATNPSACALSTQTFAANFAPPMVQTWNMDLQTQLANNWVLDIGYVGQHGTHLLESRSLNQAYPASPSNDVRGQTDNTVANIPLRVPIEGWTPGGITEYESSGWNWYNDLEVSLNKRFSNGLQFLAAYTFARDLATGVFQTNGPNGSEIIGNQDNPRLSYGPDGFIHEHRFVVSYVYELPFFKNSTKSLLRQTLGGWSLAGVTVVQSGHPLTLATFAGNPYNVYGIPSGTAQIAAGCSYNQLTTSGSIGNKLNNYFNTSCIAPQPVVGAPEPALSSGACGSAAVCPQATGFGNSGVGIVDGPAQDNWDISAIKHFPFGFINERANLEFRAEFFNTFNHPQFSDPATDYTAPNFGQITTLAVNPRVIQFALKLNF